ncbi:arylsulfatase [Aliiruegeria haliotis]|uniref:Arylsulfatase n=2 Tax=Aliiruegeria haliotis TaxID=1280846 RepID=A0A2T0RED1_9RHOB|nr:arylsulfatase [Aliiruegeria haliotis]
MSGRHPIRSGTTQVVWGVPYGLTNWEKTLAEMFSDAGYATAMFGKWHLGDIPGRFPTDQGFDEFYGILNTTDESEYSTQIGFDQSILPVPHIQQSVRDGEINEVKPFDLETRRLIDTELTEKAIDFMGRQVEVGKPFFNFIPYTQPHLPSLPHPEFDGVTGHGPYADVHVEIDHQAGRILDAIDDLGIRDNTIVIWTSDNGPEVVEPWYGTSGYWSGHYFTAMEGSLRVPFLMRWPGQIEAGSKSNEIIHTVDLLPTLATAAGLDVPQDRIIDGVDQLPHLTGQTEASAREGFPAYNGDDMFAYKWRNWKVHLIEQRHALHPPQTLNVPQIYNLITDPKEEFDLVPQGFAASWVFPPVFGEIVKFQQSLVMEPPVPFGAPEPWTPQN